MIMIFIQLVYFNVFSTRLGLVYLTSSFARFSYCGCDFAHSARFSIVWQPSVCTSLHEVIKLSGQVHGIENQDSHAKIVNGQCVCVEALCLPAWEGDNCIIYVCMCGCLVNGVCMQCCRSRGFVEAFLRIYWNQCVKHANNSWEPVVEACELCQCIQLRMRKFPAYQSIRYRYAIVWSSVLGDMWHHRVVC